MKVKARQICIDDTLGDGAIVLRTSHQLSWFYVKALARDPKTGVMRIVRRRYRHDQLVEIREE